MGSENGVENGEGQKNEKWRELKKKMVEGVGKWGGAKKGKMTGIERGTKWVGGRFLPLITPLLSRGVIRGKN